jgi:hypothetical protein
VVRTGVVATIAAAALALVPLAAAQEPGARAAASGVPRTPDGKPDLSGLWQAVNTASWDIQAHQARMGVPAGVGVVEGNDIPYQPWAAAKKKENFERGVSADPEAKCYLPGVPRLMYMPFPFQIFQTTTQLTMLFEYVHAVRTIYTNGTSHPSGRLDWWLGDSRGRWDGDTLVVDSVHFNDQTWFDKAGNFHSEQLHLVERFSPAGPDHVDYEVTVEDPKVFTRPWKMRMMLYRLKEKNLQLLEYECYTFTDEFHAPLPPR